MKATSISSEELFTKEHIQDEAIYRMRSIGIDESVIRAFQDGEVLVWEPPSGCAYSIEDEDRQIIDAFEEAHHALVWGVIRTFFNEFTIDALLYVSETEDRWEEERDNLLRMTPSVFSYMQGNLSFHELRCIRMFMSEGKTLLRDLDAIRNNETLEVSNVGWVKFVKQYESRPRLFRVLKQAKVYITPRNETVVEIPVQNTAQAIWIQDKLMKELTSGFKAYLKTDDVQIKCIVQDTI